MHRTAIVKDIKDKLKLIVSIIILIELNWKDKQSQMKIDFPVKAISTLTGRPSPTQDLHWISGETVIAQVPLLWQNRSRVPRNDRFLRKKISLNWTNNSQCHNEHHRRSYFVHDRVRLHSRPSYHSMFLSNRHEYHLQIHMDKHRVLAKEATNIMKEKSMEFTR